MFVKCYGQHWAIKQNTKLMEVGALLQKIHFQKFIGNVSKLAKSSEKYMWRASPLIKCT